MGDALFLGRWLLAAHAANEIWREMAKDARFYKKVERLELVYQMHFGFAAHGHVLDFNNQGAVVFRADDEPIGERFAVMAAMKFFVPTGQRYQLAIPTGLTRECVKRAVLALADTEDENDYLHPEKLVRTMSRVDAERWQKRLSSLDENVRCADRAILLGGYDTITLQGCQAWLPKRRS